MADTYGGVCARVQGKLNDQEVRTFSPGFLLPYVNGAYEDVALGLIQSGDPQMRKRATVTVTAGQKTINAPGGSSPALPADFLRAITLRERVASTTDPWVEMIDVRALDDSGAVGVPLTYWEPRNGTIALVGSSANRDVQIDYFVKVAALSAPSDVLAFSGGLEIIAKIAAYRAGMSRGAPADLLTLLQTEYETVMQALFGLGTRANLAPAVGK